MSSLPPPPPPPSGSVPPPPPPPHEPGFGGVPAPAPTSAPASASGSKTLWIVAGAVVLALVVGLGVFFATRSNDSSTKGAKYPDDVRKNFLTSCNEGSNGQTKYCECVLDTFQQQYSLDEFVALEQRFTNGGDTTEIEAVTKACQPLIVP